ncbi:SAV_2336 N-terminal domain-related protein [Streptomyces sp. bgisy154]|uniref:SAV_2336 N-terminal domain-related protein n=1 Tax=Streptomyces sp. bgisy154 TaxID=3413794 RepID=UPI003D73E223
MSDAAPRHGPGDPGPTPDAGPPPPDDPLAELVRRLREAGLDPDAEGLSDALWLARWARPTTPPRPGEGASAADSGQRPGRTEDAPPGASAAQSGPAPGTAAGDGAARPEAPPARGPGRDSRVALYPPARGTPVRAATTGSAAATGRGGPTLPVGVPAAPALPAPLELQRALRPLQKYRSPAPPLRRELDENATAELSARAGGLVMPVYRDVTRGDTRLQLVLDASPSMRVWDRLFTELEGVFAQLGAFGDVQVGHLHEGPEGEPVISRSPDPHRAPLHAADRLSDPTGRRITLLVSDCAGPLWRSGRAHRLLHQLARQAPAAVLQPLPQRLWNRTRLPVTYGELARGETLGGAAVLRVRTPAGASGPRAGLPLPVLPPDPAALGAWARLLSGAGSAPVSGAVGWVRADQPPAPPGAAGRPPSWVERVGRFRSTASPAAGRLAVYLAAAPLCLPVMQLVQRTMLPGSGPSELAEVLLSGLVSRAGEGYGGDGAQWYEMRPDVQEALLSTLGRDEAVLVLKHCSEYIEHRYGKGGPNFPALALAQLGNGGAGRARTPGGAYPADNGDVTLVPQPFAEVAARVLERFMPLPEQFAAHAGRAAAGPAGERPVHQAVARARFLVTRFDDEGMVQDLIDAVQLLRAATEHERAAGADPGVWAQYALSALRLWQVQGGPELLREAERAAERAVAHPHALRERAVLARVLRAAAGDRRRRGDQHGALDLLSRADREYAVACAAPGLTEDEALELTLERVGALQAQWRLGGDSALLQGAVGMLEAFADAWPDRRRRPPGLPLAHGRVLLRLACATAEPEQARAHAELAARSLRDALDAGREPGGPEPGGPESDRDGVRIRLDLVDALLKCGGPLDEAQGRIDEALLLTRDRALRSALLVRSGRVAAARYGDTGDPRALHTAADRFEQAAHGMPRDAPAHAGVLAEWGETLLRQAGPEPGAQALGSLSGAIRVLRECRTETPSGDPRLAHRLLLLGRALMARHGARADPVDLREAEHLFGLAAAGATDPLLAARCRLALGRAQFAVFRSLNRPTRLDAAVDAFRDAAESAREAEERAETERSRHDAVELCAQAHHWRGRTYEAAARPRAAREAYRTARTEWQRLPAGRPAPAGPTAEDTARRLADLG